MQSYHWIERHGIELFLLGVLAVALYGHYETGRDLARICDLLGSHNAWVAHPQTDRQEIDDICIDHQQEDGD